MKENELNVQLIKIFVEIDIKETELYLKIIKEQLKFSFQQIEYLNNAKPFFFQKKKLKEYYKKRNEHYIKIFNLYSAQKNNELKIKKLKTMLKDYKLLT